MDKIYINTKDLDIYDLMRIENIKKEIGINLNNNISVEQLLRIIESVYNELLKTKKDYIEVCNEYKSLVEEFSK